MVTRPVEGATRNPPPVLRISYVRCSYHKIDGGSALEIFGGSISVIFSDTLIFKSLENNGGPSRTLDSAVIGSFLFAYLLYF
jgi:hypothetical protein